MENKMNNSSRWRLCMLPNNQCLFLSQAILNKQWYLLNVQRIWIFKYRIFKYRNKKADFLFKVGHIMVVLSSKFQAYGESLTIIRLFLAFLWYLLASILCSMVVQLLISLCFWQLCSSLLELYHHFWLFLLARTHLQ
jgi:hypothetical protein